MMKLIRTLCTIFALAAALAAAAAQQKLVPLTVLHWNDFHAHNEPYPVSVVDSTSGKDTTYFVGGSAVLLGYLNKFRTLTPNTLALHAGDEFQGSSISSVTEGRSQIELLNLLRPDAMVLGNHEFDYGLEKLRENIGLAEFPILAANVEEISARRMLVSPVHVLSYDSLKVGIIGITTPELRVLSLPEHIAAIRLLDVDSAVTFQVSHLKRLGVDLIIVLSHMGLEKDSLLALSHPAVDLIVGGHDHIALFKPIKVNRTLIVQAGSRGQWLGKLALEVDITGDSVYAYIGRLIETRAADILPDPTAAAKVEELLRGLRTTMGEVIGELATPWVRVSGHRRGESNIGNWQADIFRHYALTDIGFQNSSGIRGDLPAGPITVGDIWRIAPFGNHIVVFRIDGKTLRDVLEFQVQASTREWLQVSGLRYTYDSRRPPGERIISIEIAGKPFNEGAEYSIATNNYVASTAMAHFGISPERLRVKRLQKLDRDIFIDAIRRQRTINSSVEGRIQDLAEEAH